MLNQTLGDWGFALIVTFFFWSQFYFSGTKPAGWKWLIESLSCSADSEKAFSPQVTKFNLGFLVGEQVFVIPAIHFVLC